MIDEVKIFGKCKDIYCPKIPLASIFMAPLVLYLSFEDKRVTITCVVHDVSIYYMQTFP